MKYFNEKANEYHIICAGSLLGIKLFKPRSFPVGKVNLMNLYPLSFPEFLDALGRTELRELIESWKGITPFPDLFHNELNEILRLYYIIGGMPEVVRNYIDSNNLLETRKTQKDIVDTYVLDFARHAPASDIPKLSIIWDTMPAISKSARACYWRSEGIAEVDFLLEHKNQILPLEVKSGINPRSKSMRVYMDKNKPDIFFRSSLLNLKKDGRVMNIPLYAISLFPVR